MIIYLTKNLINNKIYVGQDSNNNPSYLGSGKLIKRAIKKHGKENFSKETLEYCNTKEELNKAEIRWIKELKAIEKGYNISTGGNGGNLGEKVNKQIGLTQLGRIPWNKGIAMSEEAKRKSSVSHLGYKMPQSQKNKIGKANIGKVHKNARRVVGTNIKTGKIIAYDSIIVLEKEKIFNKGCVSRCCLGKRKTHKNYTWKYEG